MPQMDGVSATQLIREVHPDVPVVAMTSNIRPEDISHYFNWSKFCQSFHEVIWAAIDGFPLQV